ncbi:MAG: zinc protease [Alteromonas naphthalenivorans]|jgi:zinc protease
MVFKKVLLNGLTVLVRPVNSIPKVATRLVYHVGSKDEQTGQKGLAHLIEHMIFKGTKKLSESDINVIAEKLSGYTNAYTSHDTTGYIFDFPTQHWQEALHLYADCMQNARFDEQMLNSEMKAVIQELKMYKDDYFSDLAEKMLQSMFADHPYHYPIIGFKQDLWNVKRDALFAFYKKHYVPNNAVLVVVGDVNPDEVFTQAEKIFEGIKKDEDYARQEFYIGRDLSATTVTLKRDIKHPMMLLASVLPGEKAKKRYIFEMISILLGRGKSSRLYKKLVDELHIATDVAVMLDRLEDATVAFIYVEPKKEQDIEKIIKIVHAEIALLISDGIADRELKRATKAIKVAHISALESNEKQADAIVSSFIKTGDENFVFDYVDRSTDNLEKEIKDALRQYFSPSSMHSGKVLSLNEEERKHWVELQKLSDQEDARILEGRERSLPVEGVIHADKVQVKPSKAFSFHKPKSFLLSNGLKVFVHQNKNLPKIDIILSFKAQSHYDPVHLQGLYSFMCSMLIEGTKNYPGIKLAEVAEDYGMALSAEPGYIALSVLSEDLEKGLELLYEVLVNASFDEQEIEKVRDHLLADLTMYWDSPRDFSGHLIREKLYENHPYSQNPHGTFESVKKITRKDLIDFYAAHVSPLGARLSIVGDLEDYNIQDVLEKFLRSWKREAISKKVYPALKKITQQRVSYPINRDQIVLAFAGASINRSHSDFDKLLLFDQIFGGGVSRSMNSRLFALREQTGLFYTISGSLLAGVDEEQGMCVIKTIVSLDRLEEAKKAIIKTMSEVIDSITQEELDRAKQTVMSSRIDNFVSNKSMAGTFIAIDRFNLGDDYFDKRADVLKEISLDQVKESARKILNIEKMITFEIGRLKDEKQQNV